LIQIGRDTYDFRAHPIDSLRNHHFLYS